MTLECHIQPFPSFMDCSRHQNAEEDRVCWESERGKLAALWASGVWAEQPQLWASLIVCSRILWHLLTCSSKAVPPHFCPAVWQNLTCWQHEWLIAWAERREIRTRRTEEGRYSSVEEIVVHKTPRMGPECGESLLWDRGDGETRLVVGITGIPETEESGRGTRKDLVGGWHGWMHSSADLHVAYRINELLQLHCVKPFSECLQDVMHKRFLVGMT